jgi:hypothetical protein
VLFKHRFKLDMDALAERGVVTLPGGQQRLRLVDSLGLDPPFLGAGAV